MVLFVTITRWTPETARALPERWMTVVNGTAPKPVLDAFAKMKIVTQVISLANRFAVMVSEIEEKTSLKLSRLVCICKTFAHKSSVQS